MDNEHDDRFELALEHLDKAVAALRLALAQPEDEFIRDSIIKRFELSFETARKAMRRWLMEQGEVTAADTKKAVMEAAFRTGLVTDADVWAALTAARNDTTHEYNQARAVEIVGLARTQGLAAFEGLLANLKAR